MNLDKNPQTMHVLIYILCFSFLLILSESKITTFAEFKKVFNKVYENATEEAFREANFNRAVKRVKRLSKEHPNLKFRINAHSDLSDKEWKNILPVIEVDDEEDGEGFKVIKQPHFSGEMTSEEELLPKRKKRLPNYFDWRDKLGKWPVHDQGGKCGSCWAFSALSVVEAQWIIRDEDLHDLSKQELVDCARKSINNRLFVGDGCRGGTPKDAYRYLCHYSVTITKNYPYTGEFDAPCKQNLSHDISRYTISGYKAFANKSDEYIMRVLVEKGPVSAVIWFDSKVFSNYGGEVIRNEYRGYAKVNHGVVIVGYGYDLRQKTDYWIIRNSYGESWGEKGYFRLERGYNAMNINKKVYMAWLH